MNSIWNKNLQLFIKRFPELAKIFSLKSENDIPEDIPKDLIAPFEIIQSKQNIPTAKENGKFLHSLYNPLREAESSAQNARSSIQDCYGCVFFSAGLGYTAISYAKLFPKDTIIIVENDIRYFFTALSLVDWSDIFKHQNCILALGAGLDSVISLIENSIGIKHAAICENKSQSAHSEDYFNALHSLFERNKRKIEINASTLEKFSKLWLKNTCKNLNFLSKLDGIKLFKDCCPENLPFLILAAGPTLEEVLPHLSELKKRTILIAVDTALKCILKTGIEPDFIVITDPQYYAYRHIAGLKSPSSILITESAVYPPVFRFPCKKIIMCSSLFPLGQYIESQIGEKGTLVAGGSVSTTAWDFARFSGAKEIYCAGLDLGYPEFQTHIKGSTFEENIHITSNRIKPAEFSASRILFGADMFYEKSYSEKTILTDSKMKMFAWWFESKAEEYKSSIKNYSISDNSLKIPGFFTKTLNEVLSIPERLNERKTFLSLAEKTQPLSMEQFDIAKNNLKSGLTELYETAKKGVSIAEKGIASSRPEDFISKLSEIDSNILKSKYKEIASLVFPTEKKLSALFQNLTAMNNELKNSLQKSKLVYSELMKSIRQYQNFLKEV